MTLMESLDGIFKVFYKRDIPDIINEEVVTSGKAYFEFPVRGVTFEGRQDVLKQIDLTDGMDYTDESNTVWGRTVKPEAVHKCVLVRDKNNQYDKNAIGIIYDGTSIGFIPKEVAVYLAPLMDSGNYQIPVVKVQMHIPQDEPGNKINIGAQVGIKILT